MTFIKHLWLQEYSLISIRWMNRAVIQQAPAANGKLLVTPHIWIHGAVYKGFSRKSSRLISTTTLPQTSKAEITLTSLQLRTQALRVTQLVKVGQALTYVLLTLSPTLYSQLSPS